MSSTQRRLYSRAAIAFLLVWEAAAAWGASDSGPQGLWSHDNLVAWCVVPFDSKTRAPEARSQMLNQLGFQHFAYDWRDKDIPTFDEEIESLQKHGIELTAWWFPLDADDPLAQKMLEAFKRHQVHPQLWTPLPAKETPEAQAQLATLLRRDFVIPKTQEQWDALSEADRAELQGALAQIRAQDIPKTAAEQAQRVTHEAARVKALVELAAPYGITVELYNHNGWGGMIDNHLAIIARLKQMGVNGVGIVYNFSHARDELHDDSKSFPKLWRRMQSHVVEVNITGMKWEGQLIYPSQGDSELAMMRTIEQSGWRGRIGLEAEKGGDAAVTLKNMIIGLDWLAAELEQPGSGGAPPFASPSH